MAFDKVVDSAVLDAGLKQIADAIREKGGTSDSLAFPAAMAEAIAAIEAGGGGGGSLYISNITLAENSQYITVEHGLELSNDKLGYLALARTATRQASGVNLVCKYGSASKNGITYWGSGYIHDSNPKVKDDTGNSFSFGNTNASYPFIAGITYIVIVWALEDVA